MHEIKEVVHRENTMMIGDSNTLLNKLIDGCSVPFIYEKVGSRFKNIMIDEFQDTSHVQWQNFLPLVRNSIDGHNEALIVGDVKQAIYRWRNSDWQLLANQVDIDFKESVEHSSLGTNWRSDTNIIKFNNQIFWYLTQIFSQKIKSLTNSEDNDLCNIYAYSAQNIPENKQQNASGRVEINIVKDGTAKYADGSNKTNLDKVIDSELPRKIGELIEQGYTYKDFCILVREKKAGAKAIDALSAYGIPFISKDSLSLDSSSAVKAIVSHLKYIDNQKNVTDLAHAIESELKNGETFKEAWADREQKSDEIIALRGLGLIELVEAVIARIRPELISSQYCFVEMFQNTVQSYAANSNVNLGDFLDYYKDKSASLNVEAPENQDAVRVMTIHKSKGLQFKFVFMPYTIWAVAPQKDLIWGKIDKEPFNKLPVVAMNLKQILSKSYAEKLYRNELKMNVIDNMNLLYVAFTRAENGLFVWTSSKKESQTKNDLSIPPVSEFLCDAIADMHGNGELQLANEENDDNVTTYFAGEIAPCNESKKEVSASNVLTISSLAKQPWSERITIHRESEKDRFEKQNEVIAYGNAMHHVMEKIKTVDDIDSAIRNAKMLGEINEQQAGKIRENIEKSLTQQATSSWFDGSMKFVANESTFMSKGEDFRPDRLMMDNDGNVTIVDYKFGRRKSSEYETQVRRYMSLAKKIGHKNVRGFLWYFTENQIVEVGER